MSTVIYKTPSNVNLVSWSAVLAGSVLALSVYLILTVLGSAIAASAVKPHEVNPLDGFSYAAGAWVFISTVISLIVGGYYSGRAAHAFGCLHGVLTWCLVTLLSTYLITAAATNIVTTTASIFGKGLEAAGKGIAHTAPGVANEVKNELQEQGVYFDGDQLQREFETLLHQTGKPELSPQNVSRKAQGAADDAKATASQAATQPQQADSAFAGWLERVKQSAQPALSAADKEALVNIIQSRTGKSREESQAIADRYAQVYNQAMINFQNAKQQAEQKARNVADAAARNLARASWWTLAALIVGAIVSGAAGHLGFRSQDGDTPTDTLAVSNT